MYGKSCESNGNLASLGGCVRHLNRLMHYDDSDDFLIHYFFCVKMGIYDNLYGPYVISHIFYKEIYAQLLTDGYILNDGKMEK